MLTARAVLRGAAVVILLSVVSCSPMPGGPDAGASGGGTVGGGSSGGGSFGGGSFGGGSSGGGSFGGGSSGGGSSVGGGSAWDGGTVTSMLVVGQDGGTVMTSTGVKLTIPAGAIDVPTMITVSQTSMPAPTGFQAVTGLFTFEPDGTVFAHPVDIELPVPSATTAASVYWSRHNPDGGPLLYDNIGGTLSGSTLKAQVVHFSQGFAGQPSSTRTVNGSDVVTYQSATHSFIINRPVDFTTEAITAIIAPLDGGYREFPGSGQADGTFTIPDVPNGEYFLKQGTRYFLTDRNALDIGRARFGRPDAVPVPTQEPRLVTFSITNLFPWTLGGWLETLVPDVDQWFFDYDDVQSGHSVFDAGTTSGLYTIDLANPNWGNDPINEIEGGHAPPDHVVMGQLVQRVSDAGVPYLAMQRIAELPLFDPRDAGVVNVAMQNLPLGRNASFDVRASQFEVLAHDDAGTPLLGPAGDTFALGSAGELGTSTPGTLDIQGIAGGVQNGSIGATSDFALLNWEPGSSDFVTGGLEYGLPPNENWGPYVAVSYAYSVRYRLPCGSDLVTCPNGTAPPYIQRTRGAYLYSADAVEAFAAAPVVPLMSPVRNPTLNGQSLMQAQTGFGVRPKLAWQAPLIGTPDHYEVRVDRLSLIINPNTGEYATQHTTVATIFTTHTELLMLPGILTSGEAYSIAIIARKTGWADPAGAPDREGFPYGAAGLLSAMQQP